MQIGRPTSVGAYAQIILRHARSTSDWKPIRASAGASTPLATIRLLALHPTALPIMRASIDTVAATAMEVTTYPVSSEDSADEPSSQVASTVRVIVRKKSHGSVGETKTTN